MSKNSRDTEINKDQPFSKCGSPLDLERLIKLLISQGIPKGRLSDLLNPKSPYTVQSGGN